ncbi:response regulator transcription factor [Longirhabdus pacifica]|uniref:response regulator transcription factor n=1 Tax=Longirhabdus pacifica TaxID=2305227 RepID=UPI0010087934|nr:response regulator transcription factor [Longirhabdus pacifica]
MKVLIVEDETAIRHFIAINLRREGIDVIEASNGEEALKMALINENKDIDIAVLDVMLPTITGFDVCIKLRKHHANMGIIMLTAKGEEQDKIKGLELGADDYIIKPFSPAELVARVKALQRRRTPAVNGEKVETLYSGPFTLAMKEHKLYKHDIEMYLTPTEFHMMSLFIQHPNENISRDEILNEVWGRNYIGDLKIVDVNVRRLRKKIEEDASKPKYIQTIWGYGYIWKEE